MEIRTNPQHDIIADAAGNQVLHFAVQKIPPFATKILNITADLRMFSTPRETSLPDLTELLRQEEFIECGDPGIKNLAQKLKAANDIKTAQNIFNWISENIKYSGYVSSARGALWALQRGKGDCTEYMYLFVALCRANKIPARGIAGYVIRENSQIEAEDYHNWAEFYADGLWRIADPQKKLFMGDAKNYIAFTVLGNTTATPIEKSRKFKCNGAGLQVRME
jgi:transglutaminase-like putative cysteine protease